MRCAVPVVLLFVFALGYSCSSDRSPIAASPPNDDAEFARPIALRLRRTAKVDGGEAILPGAEAFLPSQGRTATQWSYIEAGDSSGWLVGRLEAPTPTLSGTSTTGAAFSNRASAREPHTHPAARGSFDRPTAAVRLVASRIDRTYATLPGHFRLWTPLTTITTDQMARLGTFLEEAYLRHQQLGFTYEVRTRWPVSVSVVVQAPTVDGYYSASILGVNYGSLEFNALRKPGHIDLRAFRSFHLRSADPGLCPSDVERSGGGRGSRSRMQFREQPAHPVPGVRLASM
jgi:hypothetical protein